ncbi:MAG: acetyl-CoA carboxyl transferase [Actinobacteria bacterium]|nr:acetyl-CoA carboxyl transferase [Actinomycetota bacterium]
MDNSAARARPARELIALIADSDGFGAWDEDVVSSDPLDFVDVKPYTRRLAEARAKSGTSESVLTGRAVVGGHPVVVIAGEFSFLGGSTGIASGERTARAFERAADLSLPVIALPSSGGARMQEGSLALMQVIKTAAAATRFRRAGLPYIAYLSHPTTGGVLASWGSLAHLTFAMPGALIGLMGPRVMSLAQGASLEVIQRAEHLLARGLVDGIFPPEELQARLARLLSTLDHSVDPYPLDASPTEEFVPGRKDAWESVNLSRNPDRPGARALIEACATDLTVIHGDALGGGDDPSCFAAIGRVTGVPAVILAQDRDAGPGPSPAAFRKARRGVRLADELGLPLVTVVDTSRAEVTAEAEAGGLAAEIARCLGEVTDLRTPTVSVLLGEARGGLSLPLLPADRVICAENAWLGPIAPEGASAILYRDKSHAHELARAQGVSPLALLGFGIIDVVVPEFPSADKEPREFVERVTAFIATQLRSLVAQDSGERLAARVARYRGIGEVTARDG